jgi:phospholipid/cholesterol/gamma-HCH transport system ATP-binding protein
MRELKGAVVALDHVSKSFGEKQVLRDITFSVAREETICLLGRSGTGKSVSLKLMIALIKPEAGQVWIDGEDITQLKGQELSRVRRKMGFRYCLYNENTVSGCSGIVCRRWP